MATIKAAHALAKKSFVGFGGMCADKPLSGEGASDMCNFRIREDGTLITREGYQMLTYFPEGRVRGLWQGVLGGEKQLYAVSGATVWRLDPTTLEKSEAGTLTDGDSPVRFCVFAESLYLFTGSEILVLEEASRRFSPISPYVPLYGENWSPTSYGEVYEAINLLTPRLRVRYNCTAADSVFYLPYYAESVERVLVDGLPATYQFQTGSDTVTVTGRVGAKVEIAFTVELNREVRGNLLRTLPYLFSTPEGERLLLWGASGDICLYPNTPVTAHMQNYASLSVGAVDPLYFKSDDVLFLGDHTHPVGNLLPFYDGALAISEEQTWLLRFEKEEGFLAETVLHGFGAPPGAAAVCASDTLVFCAGSLYHLKASVSHPEEIHPQRISPPPSQMHFAAMLSPILFYERETDEVWLRDTEEESGEVWVWNRGRKEWYRFDGIRASQFFADAKGTHFADGNVLFRFEKGCYTDDGNSFEAYYQSNVFDLSVAERVRRALCVSLCAHTYGAATLTLESERKRQIFALDAPQNESFPTYTQVRFLSHRHRFLRYRLSALGSEQSKISKLSFFTEP